MQGLAVVLLLLGILQSELGLLPPLAFLAIVAVWFAIAARKGAPMWISPRNAFVFALLGLGSLVFASGVTFLVPSMRWRDPVASAAAHALLPWAFVLFLFRSKDAGPEELSENTSGAAVSTWKASALLLVSFALFAALHWFLERDIVTYFDEPLYLLQGRLMREPGFVRPIDESLSQFFILRQTVYSAGRLYTQYPPGQPALLALFDIAGLRWWVGVVASSLGVLFTYLLARDLFSQRAGIVAAALLATNEYIVGYSTSYMPHGPGLALTTAAAWLTLRGSDRDRRHQTWSWSLAGLLLGCLVAIRPLTGVVISVSIVLWLMLLRRRWRDLPRLAACMAIGGVLPIVGLLLYDYITNGSPFVMGYQAVHGSLHNLGFGQRGWVVPGLDGRWTTELVQFTPRRAVVNAFRVMFDLTMVIDPTLLLVPPLVLLAAYYKVSVRYLPAMAFLLLPTVHFFYFYEHARFNLELFPLLFIGIAGLLIRLERVNRPLFRGILAAMLLGQVTCTGLFIKRRRANQVATPSAVFDALRNTAREEGNLLVFVKNPNVLGYLAWFNIDRFPGDIIVARDLGGDNAILMRRFPRHVPVLLSGNGGQFQITRMP